MAELTVRGATIHYEVLGDAGPWVALTPGGRQDLEAVRHLGERVAGAGYRVLLHDRRNTGSSDVVIDGDESEQQIWADDLHELLQRLDALPAWVGGGSAGCRVSLLLAIRHPEAVRGLLLWWVTGGRYAADYLSEQYYSQFIRAAEAGGMAAVCETPFFADRIAARPANRDRLMAMPPARFIAVMSRWYDWFVAGADLPVIGATEGDLRALGMPVCIIPGVDQIHPTPVAERLHHIVEQSEFHPIYSLAEVAALPSPLDPPAQLDRQRRIADVFTDFLARQAEAAAGVTA